MSSSRAPPAPAAAAAAATAAAAPATVGQMIWVTQGSTQHLAHVLETKDNGLLFIRWDSNCDTQWIGPEVLVSTELPSRRRGNKPVYNEAKMLTELVVKQPPKDKKKPAPKRGRKSTTATTTSTPTTSRSNRSRRDSRSRSRSRSRTSGTKKRTRREIYREEESEEEDDAIVPERRLPERSSKRARISYADGDSDVEDDDDAVAVEPDLQSRSSRTSSRKKGRSVSSKDAANLEEPPEEDDDEEDEEMRDTPHNDAVRYAVGTSVAKKCKRRGWVAGTIVSTAGSFYRVKFSDSRERVKGSDIGQMVYDADTTRYLISTPIKKRFSDSILNSGKVIRIENSLYHVLYKDGAEEILGASEMDEVVKSSSSKRKKSNSLAAKAGSVAMIDQKNREELTQTAGQSTDSDGIPRTRSEAELVTGAESNHAEEISLTAKASFNGAAKPPPDPPSDIFARKDDSSSIHDDKPELEEQVEKLIVSSSSPSHGEAKPVSAPEEESTSEEAETAPFPQMNDQSAPEAEAAIAQDGSNSSHGEVETTQDGTVKTAGANNISINEFEKSALNGDVAGEVDPSAAVPETEHRVDAGSSVDSREEKMLCENKDEKSATAPAMSGAEVNTQESPPTPVDTGLKDSEEGNLEKKPNQLPAPDNEQKFGNETNTSEGASSNANEPNSTIEITATKFHEKEQSKKISENAVTKDTHGLRATQKIPTDKKKQPQQPSDQLLSRDRAATTVESNRPSKGSKSSESSTSTKSKLDGLAGSARTSQSSETKRKRDFAIAQHEAKSSRQRYYEGGLDFSSAVSRATFASLAASLNKNSRNFAEPPGTSQTSQGATKYKDHYSEPFDPTKKADTYSMPLQPAEHEASSRSRAGQPQPRSPGPRVQDSAAKRIAQALERTAKSKEEQNRPKQVNAGPSPQTGTVSTKEQKGSNQAKATGASPRVGSVSSRQVTERLQSETAARLQLEDRLKAARLQSEDRLKAAKLQSTLQTRQSDEEARHRSQLELAAFQNAGAQQFGQNRYLGSAPWNASSTLVGTHLQQRSTAPHKKPTPDPQHSVRVGIYDDAPETGGQHGRSDSAYYQNRKEVPVNLHRHSDPALYFALNRPNSNSSNALQRPAPARGIETYGGGSRAALGTASNSFMPSSSSLGGRSAILSALAASRASRAYPIVGYGIASLPSSRAGNFDSRAPRASVDPPGEVAKKKSKKGAK